MKQPIRGIDYLTVRGGDSARRDAGPELTKNEAKQNEGSRSSSAGYGIPTQSVAADDGTPPSQLAKIW